MPAGLAQIPCISRFFMDDVAVLNGYDSISELGQGMVVGDHDQGLVVFSHLILEQSNDFGRGIGVQVSGWLISEDDLGVPN